MIIIINRFQGYLKIVYALNIKYYKILDFVRRDKFYGFESSKIMIQKNYFLIVPH